MRSTTWMASSRSIARAGSIRLRSGRSGRSCARPLSATAPPSRGRCDRGALGLVPAVLAPLCVRHLEDPPSARAPKQLECVHTAMTELIAQAKLVLHPDHPEVGVYVHDRAPDPLMERLRGAADALEPLSDRHDA